MPFKPSICKMMMISFFLWLLWITYNKKPINPLWWTWVQTWFNSLQVWKWCYLSLHSGLINSKDQEFVVIIVINIFNMNKTHLKCSNKWIKLMEGVWKTQRLKEFPSFEDSLWLPLPIWQFLNSNSHHTIKL